MTIDAPYPGKPGENVAVGSITIGDYLIRRLHHYGVEHSFGVPGDYVITLYEQMQQSQLILPINTCDEQGSGFAADAYARLRGLGVCCQTYGVGGLKALHTTAEAFTERSPVVVVSGAPGLNERGKGTLLHHLIDGYYSQLKMFAEVTVASTILEEAGAAFGEIDRVLSAALQHKRPVYIEIPRDMFTYPAIFAVLAAIGPPCQKLWRRSSSLLMTLNNRSFGPG
jgi:TPP-dependent 2-oxoacid decarboxylase